jgi:hypothetical protein
MNRFTLLIPILLAGCGPSGKPPALSAISMSALKVPVGPPFFATLHATDPDGDLVGGNATIHLHSTNSTQVSPFDLTQNVSISGDAPTQQETELIYQLGLRGQIGSGPALLEITVEDGAGNGSNTAQAELMLSAPTIYF